MSFCNRSVGMTASVVKLSVPRAWVGPMMVHKYQPELVSACTILLYRVPTLLNTAMLLRSKSANTLPTCSLKRVTPLAGLA